MNLKFEQYIDLSNINDSMELISGTEIAILSKDNVFVLASVVGDVCVYYNEETYRSVRNFPAELLKSIHDGNNDYEVENNNWFEISFYRDNELIDGEVYNLENASSYELFEQMLEYLEYYDNKE